jgi:hypothetical protein
VFGHIVNNHAHGPAPLLPGPRGTISRGRCAGHAGIVVQSRQLKYSYRDHSDLEHNPAHQFAAACALQLYRRDAIYTFIPKNACSTMRLSVAVDNCVIPGVEQVEWIHHNNRTFRADLRALVTARYTFVILRCPLSRVVSAFLDRICNLTQDAWTFYQLTNRLKEPKDVTFKDFVRALAHPPVRKGDMHWRPQVDFLVYERYDDYFCFEEFTTVAESLKHRIGLEVLDARDRSRHVLERFELVDDPAASTLSASAILAMKNAGKCPSPRSLLDDEAMKLLTRFYAADIDLYGKLFGRSRMLCAG